MKDMDYGKGYVYPPDNGYKRVPDEHFLPPVLHGKAPLFDERDVEPGHALAFGANSRPRVATE